MECGLTLCWNLKPYYWLDTLSLVFSPLFLCKVCTVPVIPLIFALILNLLLSELLKALRSTVAVICLALFYKLLCIFFIDIEPLGLDIRTTRTTYDRTFIPFYSKPIESLIEVIKGFIAIALPISILDS